MFFRCWDYLVFSWELQKPLQAASTSYVNYECKKTKKHSMGTCFTNFTIICNFKSCLIIFVLPPGRLEPLIYEVKYLFCDRLDKFSGHSTLGRFLFSKWNNLSSIFIWLLKLHVLSIALLLQTSSLKERRKEWNSQCSGTASWFTILY